MISRYTREAMGKVWHADSRFNYMLQVEVAVAQAQAQNKIIPQKAYLDIKRKAKFSVPRILEIEQKTKHDVIAFVSSVAENVGPSGRYVHFGMTSSDVLDTAFSLQVRAAGELLLSEVVLLEKTLRSVIKKHTRTLCAGRTHGMFAEITTFGYKLTGFLLELMRNKQRLQNSLMQMQICKLSGAVGTFSSQPEKIESQVAKLLKLQREPLATQVVPRDRHAELLHSMALMATGLERLSIELRHLQRSEVAEVVEGFTPGQKGSSAMPHKKNPISAENITGLSRLMRSYASAAMENVALWHERDISHSSVERVIFPDAFIVLDYALSRMRLLLGGLFIDAQQMQANVQRSAGTLFSSQILLALVDKGLSREAAYALVQRLSHGLTAGEHLQTALLNDAESGEYFTKAELEKLFAGVNLLKQLDQRVQKILKEAK